MSLISARWVSIFQSTLSVRRATPIFDETYRAKLFQSTLSVRRATNLLRKNFDGTRFQSTLSVRRATLQLAGEVRHADISIHALRKESDTGERRQMAKLLLFQSTLSVRRATASGTTTPATIKDFNPRSP